jgi:hypothetical protein
MTLILSVRWLVVHLRLDTTKEHVFWGDWSACSSCIVHSRFKQSTFILFIYFSSILFGAGEGGEGRGPIWPFKRNKNISTNERGELTASYKWTNWVWVITIRVQDFMKTTNHFRKIYETYLKWIKKTKRSHQRVISWTWKH